MGALADCAAFLVNLFASPQPGEIPPAAQRAALEAVARYYVEYGMPVPEPVKPPYAPDFEGQLDAVERIRPGPSPRISRRCPTTG